jgi:hypothetical protein
MPKLLSNLRLVAFIYSLLMLACIESVGIFSQGNVELEKDRRDIYGSVLLATLTSYITEKSITKNDT